MIKILTKDIFKKIRKSNDFGEIIGYAENSFFDAKGSSYNFLEPKNSHEIAKDITAFANGKGGFLLIGCETGSVKSTPVDYVIAADGLTEFPDIDQMGKILEKNVYPNSIERFVEYDKITDKRGKKFLLINVNGSSEDKPYLAKKESNDNEFASYYVRTNDRGVRHEISYIHELMRQGIYFESYLRNLTGVAEKILSNSEKLLQASTRPKKAISAFDIYQNL